MNGLLLINLGTPDAPDAPSVRRYLAEFLSDPRVLDMHPAARWLLLHGVILRVRPRKSAAAYREIWDGTHGSPLLYHSQALADGVRAALGQGWAVALGMRYGSPSFKGALDQLIRDGAERIVVLPLYPQYASSSTGSSLEAVYTYAAGLEVVPPLTAVQDFYDHPGFLSSVVAAAREPLAAARADHVLFSFHGLPERHVARTAAPGHCLSSGCCDRISADNRSCYRAQSYATARALAARLQLEDDGWSVGFQSRLGRTPWIQPFTDALLPELAERGIKRLAVMCPSFTADCLETLEEIQIRAKEDFLAAGGEDLQLIPCVNSHPRWVEAVSTLARAAIAAPAQAQAPAHHA